ncbi:hypothetical protein HAX54_053116 [Datura stramonium]|uniref:Uncharacterized protein n=1 Tax=Datura stramonium TaxID=4076 RepID=A0ABS8WT62_DATST|nr:hypothetical protein [Datura stramonium]
MLPMAAGFCSRPLAFGGMETTSICQFADVARNFKPAIECHDHRFKFYNAASIVEAAGRGDVNMEESSKKQC